MSACTTSAIFVGALIGGVIGGTGGGIADAAIKGSSLLKGAIFGAAEGAVTGALVGVGAGGSDVLTKEGGKFAIREGTKNIMVEGLKSFGKEAAKVGAKVLANTTVQLGLAAKSAVSSMLNNGNINIGQPFEDTNLKSDLIGAATATVQVVGGLTAIAVGGPVLKTLGFIAFLKGLHDIGASYAAVAQSLAGSMSLEDIDPSFAKNMAKQLTTQLTIEERIGIERAVNNFDNTFNLIPTGDKITGSLSTVLDISEHILNKK